MNADKFAQRTQFSLNFGYLANELYGVQEQPNFPTVMGNVRKRIEEISNQKAKALMISARTDRFVTVLNNYVTFWLKNPINIKELEIFRQLYDDDTESEILIIDNNIFSFSFNIKQGILISSFKDNKRVFKIN